MTQTDKAHAGVKQMLLNRRHKIQAEVNDRKRSGRENRTSDVRDMVDVSDSGIEEEMSFTLLQMRTSLLSRVDAALARLESGTYGVCFECGDSIALPRLRALPFAVRCRDCETQLEEQANQRRQRHALDDGRISFPPEIRSL